MRYDFCCDSCGKIWEAELKMADYQKPLSEPCPLCEVSGQVRRFYGPDSIPRIADPYNVMGLKRMNSDFMNQLSNIKKFYKQDHINDSGTIT